MPDVPPLSGMPGVAKSTGSIPREGNPAKKTGGMGLIRKIAGGIVLAIVAVPVIGLAGSSLLMNVLFPVADRVAIEPSGEYAETPMSERTEKELLSDIFKALDIDAYTEKYGSPAFKALLEQSGTLED